MEGYPSSAGKAAGQRTKESLELHLFQGLLWGQNGIRRPSSIWLEGILACLLLY